MSELRSIPGFPNYSVTRDGKIWTHARPRVRGGWMKTDTHEGGYSYVNARVDGRQVKLYAHRAVALAWIGECPEGKPFACHSDGDPANNDVSNLYWGDQFDNMSDMVAHGKSRLGGKW